MNRTAKTSMRESALERKCGKLVKELGGKFYKLTGHRGVPDRLMVLKGHCVFVELKRSGTGALSPVQSQEIKRLRELHARVWVVFDYLLFEEMVYSLASEPYAIR